MLQRRVTMRAIDVAGGRVAARMRPGLTGLTRSTHEGTGLQGVERTAFGLWRPVGS